MKRLAGPRIASTRRWVRHSSDLYKKYGDTLALPSTPYGANAPSPQEEAQLVERTGQDLYRWQHANLNKDSTVVFHDGPPYANGNLHTGHALNKVIKDVINRYNLMRGRRVEYRPGWDCHGLPIELTTIANAKKKKIQYNSLSMDERRKMCAATALSMVEGQKEGFRSYGVMADWDGDTYKTLTNDYVVRQLGVFREMMKRGLITRKNRPVYWSVESQTALAESELEYKEKQSTAIYVKYKLEQLPTSLQSLTEHVYLVIWTTTPWTLPSNQAIAVHEDIEYGVLKSSHGYLVVAIDRASELEHDLNGQLLDGVRIKGSQLVGLQYSCLMKKGNDRFPVLSGSHVTSSSGTGLVHSAPGHGMEDYLMCYEHNISPYSPINDYGQYTDALHGAFKPQLVGLDARKNQQLVLQLAQECGALIGRDDGYKHNVPCDWRSKQPVLVRSTPQFFADISTIKQQALDALDNVKFTPAVGKNRLTAFTQSRSEWCISRQRVWGVPIPALYKKSNGELLMTDETVSTIIERVEQKGIDQWFKEEDNVCEWLPQSLQSQGTEYKKGFETMDVWFDSGTSWTMLEHKQAEYYFEGSDQHRGWFQSSLLTKVAATGTAVAPFKQVVTHGFVLDKDGRKMSKSLGNIISPEDIKTTGKKNNKLGVDGLRLWVAQSDYTVDVTLSSAALDQIASMLRKFRLTFKFMLGNMGSFDGVAVPYEQLSSVDKKALNDLAKLDIAALEAYESLQFTKVVKLLQNHMNVDLSALYFDMVKDRVYADATHSLSRRSVQTVFTEILKTYIHILSPIAPLSCQQVWDHTPKYITRGESTPFQVPWQPRQLTHLVNSQIEQDFEQIVKIRSHVLGAMELGRAQKHVRSSLGTEVYLTTCDSEAEQVLTKYEQYLPEIFITSKVHFNQNLPSDLDWVYESRGDGVQVAVVPPTLHKCPRCWTFTAEDPESLCKRCDEAI